MVNLMKMSDLSEYSDYVFALYSELPEEYRELTYKVNGKTRNRDDVVSPFMNGKEWTYEYILKFQPRTARQLLSGGELKFVVNISTENYNTHLAQEVNGQVIEIRREPLGFNPDDADYHSNIEKINAKLTKRWGYPREKIERQLSIPEPIRMAYYHRIDGLNIPDSPAFGSFTRILPYPISRPWQTIDGYLGDLRLKTKLLPVVEEMIPGIRPDEKDMPYTNFMMFLNSWGSFNGKKRTEGDHLFVKNHIQDGVVYYIRDADVANMMILADPTESIDRYCEHVLLRKEGRFDFRPWAVPF